MRRPNPSTTAFFTAKRAREGAFACDVCVVRVVALCFSACAARRMQASRYDGAPRAGWIAVSVWRFFTSARGRGDASVDEDSRETRWCAMVRPRRGEDVTRALTARFSLRRRRRLASRALRDRFSRLGRRGPRRLPSLPSRTPPYRRPVRCAAPGHSDLIYDS